MVLTLAVVGVLGSGMAGPRASIQGSEFSRQLQDLPVFAEKTSSQAVENRGQLRVTVGPDGRLPVERLDDQPALRVEATGNGGGTSGFTVLMAANDWRTWDLSTYVANGALEFEAKGEKGGESFSWRMKDRSSGAPRDTALVRVEGFGRVGTEWTAFRIPLRRFWAGQSPMREVWHLDLLSGSARPQTFWLRNIRFTSPDKELALPSLKLNQAGYDAAGSKRFLVSNFPDVLNLEDGAGFAIRRSGEESVLFRGALRLRSALDGRTSGERVLVGDFSALRQPGRYELRVQGLRQTATFRIDRSPTRALLRDALRYFYLQRSGMPLEAKYAGEFARGEGHPQDRALALQSQPDGPKRDVSGGWYDAGDYGKYVSMAAKPVSDLLLAYEEFPKLFPDGGSGIPESGNKVPDLLDEVRYELEWILKMQDPVSGGFWQKVWPQNAPATPDVDQQVRFIYDRVGELGNVRPTGATANAAAVLAHAAVVYRPVDGLFSERLLLAARRGWAHLEATPEVVVARGMIGAMEEDRGARMWAAAALYRASGESPFKAYWEARYREFDRFWKSRNDSSFGDDITMLAWVHYLRGWDPDPTARAWFAEHFRTWRAMQAERLAREPWGNYLLDEDYYWGSNSVICDTNTLLYLGTKLLGDDLRPVIDGARQSMDYLLGLNPLGFSYVSGYGANSVREIYSLIYSNDRLAKIPPGYLAGGPNSYEGRWYSRFNARCYRDSDTDWTVNENAIYWNSALVFLAALVEGS